jgi:5-methylcytosine-specific restriction endonuclease McrA
MKKCSKCGEEKEATSKFFHKRKACKDGFKGECKVCSKEYMKQYREVNHDRSNALSRAWRVANPEKSKASTNAYRKINPEKIKASTKAWCHTHPERRRQSLQQYRTRKLNLPNTLTLKQWETTVSNFNNCCAYCGKEKPLSQDHFLALSKGGSYTEDNIIPSCRSCNSSKGSKTFLPWYLHQNSYSKEREEKILLYLVYKNNVQQLALL